MSATHSTPTAATLVQGVPTVTMATVMGFAAMLLVSAVVLLTDGAVLPVIGSGLTGF